MGQLPKLLIGTVYNAVKDGGGPRAPSKINAFDINTNRVQIYSTPIGKIIRNA